jgi:DNA (cytosine-5)-methyltransferase 1
MANAGTKLWLGNQEAFSGDYRIHQKVYENHPADSRVKDMGDLCQTVTSRWGTDGGNVPIVQEAVGFTQCDAARDTGIEISPTLRSGGNGGYPNHAVSYQTKVRRLTPIECERLQGFPDNYTNIPWNGKAEAPDGHRYKALGNSMAVPVMQWIGDGIDML